MLRMWIHMQGGYGNKFYNYNKNNQFYWQGKTLVLIYKT